jgi:hypothetical protein
MRGWLFRGLVVGAHACINLSEGNPAVQGLLIQDSMKNIRIAIRA